MFRRVTSLAFLIVPFSVACSQSTMTLDEDAAATDGARADVRMIDSPIDVPVVDVPPNDAAAGTFCSTGVPVVGVPGPTGYCVRAFLNNPTTTDFRGQHAHLNPRSLVVAPNGDVFVSSPISPGAGGGSSGVGGILVLTDDNHDGVAESHNFLVSNESSGVHAIALSSDAMYFTVSGGVMRTPYALGDRAASAMPTSFATVAQTGRWTHGLARSQAGMTYYTTGAESTATCPQSDAGHIDLIASDGTVTTAARGFRNPMYVRCHYRDEVCAATELGDDGGSSFQAHEKLFLIRPSTYYGYPCCTTTGQASPEGQAHNDNCSAVAMEDAQFPLNDTPFGMDWERGIWSGAMANVLCVAKHGSFYSQPAWQGAGVFCAPTNATTHAPSGPFQLFVGGFGPSGTQLERPADVAFAPDGRMFFADDIGNSVYWVAPVDLMMPTH